MRPRIPDWVIENVTLLVILLIAAWLGIVYLILLLQWPGIR